MCVSLDLRKYVCTPLEWSDLVAECYVLLKQDVPDEGLFVASYLSSNPEGGPENPNIETLRRLEDVIRNKVCFELEGFSSHDEAIEGVLEAVGGVSLQDFEDTRLNRATILWKTIKGIDGGYASCDLFDELENRGPMNSVHRDTVGVYLRPLVWTALRQAYRNARGAAVPETGLNEILRAILIYEKEPGRDLPKIVLTDPGKNAAHSMDAMELNWRLLQKTDEGLAASRQSGELVVSVGLELFSGADVFKSYGNAGPLLRQVFVMGKSFGVKYEQGYEQLVLDVVRDSIDSAIAQGCQVLVMPEMVVSPLLSNMISQLLRDERRRGWLSLVVAGSGWKECDGGGDNVCNLYDGFGQLIGTYHKCSPFLPKSEEDKEYEALAHPAQTCTVVDVRGLGRVLPSICKDLGTKGERYTARLGTTFDSDLVCVPALSSSLSKVFDDQLHTLVTRAFSHCVVCNLCGARKEYRVDNGAATWQADDSLPVALVGHPVPSATNPNNVEYEPVEISRTRQCHRHCLEDFEKHRMHSCLHVLRISTHRSKDGTVLSVVEPRCKQ